MKKSELRQIIKEEIKQLLNEGTPGVIGVKDPKSGTIKSVYINYDAYPDYTGKILSTYYKDLNKANKLVSIGDMSDVGKNIQKSKENAYNKPPEKFRDVEKFSKRAYDENASYVYLFDPEQGGWLVSRGGLSDFKKI